MGSNGLTSARHDVFSKELAAEFPESYDNGLPAEVVYCGNCSLTEPVRTPVDAGRLVLSPTRTYAPVVKAVLSELRPAMSTAWCTARAAHRPKIMNFVEGKHVIKDNLFEVPRFSTSYAANRARIRAKCTRFSIWVTVCTAHPPQPRQIIEIAEGFGIEAKVIGRVEEAMAKKLTLATPYGTFTY